MEQIKKNLRTDAILVLIWAVFTLAQAVLTLIFSIDLSIFPMGVSEGDVLIAKIVIGAIAVLLLVPQLYVGIRGLQLIKNPSKAKGHIVWATVIFVLAAVGLIPHVISIFRNGDIGESVASISSLTLEMLIYYDFIRHAKALQKHAD